MIIDSHEHVMLPIEKQITEMEKAGVDKTILFMTTPHPEKANNYEELHQEMSILYKSLGGNNSVQANVERIKVGNQELLTSINTFPDKFYGFGGVPLGLTVNETNKWIEKQVVANGFKGTGEYTPGSDEQMAQLETLFKALQDYPQLPLWVHTFNPVTLNGLRILMEFTEKYSTTPVIFGHMGGYNWQTLIEFAQHTKNAYLDISAVFSTLALRMVISELPDKCFYSSDAPYGDALLSRQMIEYLSPSKEVAKMVLGENIAGLLQL